MDTEYIKTRVAEISACATAGDEQAHHLEDILHQEVLRKIAGGEGTQNDYEQWAAEALKTSVIRFRRRCA